MRHKMILAALALVLFVAPVFAQPTKTTAIDTVDAWQAVVAATAVVGNAKDVSASYGTILYVEIALTEAVAHGTGSMFIVEVSYADDEWVQMSRHRGTIETAGTTTINDGSVTAGDTTVTLTDATTADFDVPGRKWFIKDGTIANSETVRTVVNAVHTVTIAQDLIRSHANGLNVYDRVDEWIIAIPFAVSQIRVIAINDDADCDMAFTTRVSQVTAM